MELFLIMSANLFGGIICLILGLIIRTGKANYLISGYNTASEKEQAKWNIEKLSGFVGSLLIVGAIILIIACVFIFFDIAWLVAIFVSFGIFMVIILLGVAYINTSPRFKSGK